MGLILNLLVNAVAVFASAYLLDGVVVDGFRTALIVAVVLGLLNTFIKPIFSILTLPINLITLGLFSFILNGLFILLASNLVDGFEVEGLLWAILFSIVLSFVSSVLGIFVK